jgi:hypothetical protein
VVSILDVSFGVLMHGWERKVRGTRCKGSAWVEKSQVKPSLKNYPVLN